MYGMDRRASLIAFALVSRHRAGDPRRGAPGGQTAAEAEAVSHEDLRVHPNNGWPLAGLEQSLRAQGRERDADDVALRLAAVWQRADVWLLGSRMPPQAPSAGAARPAAPHH
jgi:hypothetical protein